jgi:tetratricopeptide (TPR) repeat protein
MLAEAATAAPPQKAYFLRIQAIAAFGAAMEAYPKTTFSLQLARAQFLLGRVCLDQATASDERMQEVYLLRSIGAYEASSLNFDKDSHLDEWSECHFCIGLAFLIHSETSDKDVAIDDLQKAINQFEVALPGFQAINSENLKKLEKARQRAIETLDKLRQP